MRLYFFKSFYLNVGSLTFRLQQDIQQQRCDQFKFEDSSTSFYRFNTDGTYLGQYQRYGGIKILSLYLGAPETGRKPFQDVSNSNRHGQQQCQQRASSEPDLTRVDCAMRYFIELI